MSHTLATYIPRWLLAQLEKDAVAPGEAYSLDAAVLVADIAGFTPLTEAVAQRGLQGVEVLSQILEAVFGTLVETILAYGGDVAWFAGDALTAFWPLVDEDDNAVFQAVAAAQAVQAVMRRFDVPTPEGTRPLALRVGLGCGPVRLMVVGDDRHQRFVFTGSALAYATTAEKRAPLGQIVLHASVCQRAGATVEHGAGGILTRLQAHVSPSRPKPLTDVSPARLRPFVHPTLAERVESGQGAFLADFRHSVVPMFVSFAADSPTAIQGYVTQAIKVTERHGGYLSEVKVSDEGNELVILFGAPLSLGNNSARAAACALDLAALPSTQAIGATRGTLLAGVVGSERRRQYATPGDEMNLAARLMQTARRSNTRPAILVSARVCHQAGTRFTYGERQLLPVRGKSEPVAAMRLLGWAQRWKDWLSPWIDQDDLIGRRVELSMLEERIDRTLKGQGQVLTVSGEAGIGKTRLMGELLRRWLQRGGVAYLGAALASAQHDPYHAWGELLRAFFDLRGDAGDPDRTKAALQAINPDLVSRLPLLSDVLGLSMPDSDLTRHFDAQLRQQSTQALLVDLIRHRADQQPLVLVLDDVHWLDHLSWELALAVARAICDLPVLLCLLHRPLTEPLPGPYRTLIGLLHHAALPLSELSPTETVALACARLGVTSLPEDLAELVQTRAQGHPFFIEEIINTLRESDLVRQEDGCVMIAGDLRQVRLPDTVRGVVQARIDRLDESNRLTLKAASVIGRTFLYRTLHDVHPANIPHVTLHAQLDTLERLDITPLERSKPDLTYVFKHAITQEVTYQTLSFAQRRALHQAVAEWYETTFGENGARATSSVSATLAPYFPLLAYHYRHAGDTERERHYTRLAGEQAVAQYANEEALTYLNRALELTPQYDLAERYELLLAREKVYDLQGARKAQGQDLTTLELLAEALTDDRRRAEVALRQANYANVTGDHDAAVAASRAAIRLAQATQDANAEMTGFLEWGRSLQPQGKYQAAQLPLEQALARAQAAQLRRGEADSLRGLGINHFYLCDYAKARSYFEQALHIHREIDDRRGEGQALNNLGVVAKNQRDYAKARNHLEQALRIQRELGDRLDQNIALLNLSTISLIQDDYGETKGHLEQALRTSREIGSPHHEALTFNKFGNLFQKQGNFDRARAFYEKALRRWREINDRQRECLTLTSLGLIFHHLGDHQAAYEHCQQALQIEQELGNLSNQSRTLTCLGHALTGLGRLSEAVEIYRQALAWEQELDNSDLILDILSGLARVFMAQENQAQAQAHVEEIMSHLKNGTWDVIDKPFRIHQTCYHILRANQDPRAQDILSTAHSLLQERAAKIEDKELRRLFFENVAAHREIVGEWRAANGE